MADADSSRARRAELPRGRAKRLGETRYFGGIPCRLGHDAPRFTSNGCCCACTEESSARYRAANPEKFRESTRRSKAKNRDMREERRRAQRAENDPGLAQRRPERQHDRDSRAAALAAGDETYASMRACIYGHVGSRFTAGYGCVGCWSSRLKPEPAEIVREREQRRADMLARSERWRLTVENRNAALEVGSTQYFGAICRLGHEGLRWTSSYGCVACGRLDDAKREKHHYDRAYRVEHADEVLARAREWVRMNPGKRKAIRNACRDRRRQQCEGGDATAAIYGWEKNAKKVCHWCGCKCPKTYHVDHYQPLSKGGKHEVSNLVIACAKCNLRKSAKDPFEFAASMGRLF